MTYPTCEVCGCSTEPLFSGRGSKLADHVPGGELCRRRQREARAEVWRAEAHERDLVRVTGALINDLSLRIEPVYGPCFFSEAELLATAVAAGWEKLQRKPGVSVGAYFPRWAVVVAEVFGSFWTEEKVRAFEAARDDEEWRAALLTVYALAETPAAARKAAAVFCKRSAP